MNESILAGSRVFVNFAMRYLHTNVVCDKR